jgi:serine/threonine protein kinase/Tol biopolymer transport system component
MTAERWQQIARIYDTAADLADEERDRYLAEACRGDADLRGEVASLLADSHARLLIDAPVWEAAAGLIEPAAELPPGRTLGPYRIETLLGSGGMGQVYRAYDTRLNRTVAIKVIADDLAAVTAFRERFEREARVLAVLGHPHICTLYDVGRDEGVEYLVMEYVEGETLASLLTRGPLSVGDAIRFAAEIAEALDAAHRRGVIHRDLKPGNVMITRTGTSRPGAPHAMLLDFGLAKSAAAAALPASDGDPGTKGSIAGTLRYMAPEQREGRDSDARTDIFALGALLHEMLTGTARAGSPPLKESWPDVPIALERAIATCLETDPDGRWQSAADLARALRWMAVDASTSGAPSPAPVTSRTAALLAVAALTIATAASLITFMLREPPAPSEFAQFELALPGGWTLADLTVVSSSNAVTTNPLAVSRDGGRIAFVARNNRGEQRLWIRTLDQAQPRMIDGTDGAAEPFWSADGGELAFFADRKLKKVDIDAGVVTAICDAAGRGGSWGADGDILFASDGVIHHVHATGGSPRPVTTRAAGEQSHIRPMFLPDGRHFVYYAFKPGGPQIVYFTSLGTSERRELLQTEATNVGYARGHVLFVRGRQLLAQPIDISQGALSGVPITVIEDIQTQPAMPTLGVFAVAENGLLVYQASHGPPHSTLTWFDRAGTPIATVGEPANFAHIRLSPDGARVAVNVLDDTSDGGDAWIYDLPSGTRSRFTFDNTPETTLAWSPDGRQIVFGSQRAKPAVIVKTADGSGVERPLRLDDTRLGLGRQPNDWSPDGRRILLFAGSDLWTVAAEGDPDVTPWIGGNDQKIFAQFDPSGRYVAYQGSGTGRPEIYIESFPGPGGKWLVSTAGGIMPRWRNDGRELFYIGPDDALIAVPVAAGESSVQVGRAQPLFQTRRKAMSTRFGYSYDVAPDGRRFLINTSPAPGPLSPLTVVMHWTPGL